MGSRPIEVTVEADEERATFHVRGELDLTATDELIDAVRTVPPGCRRVELDLREVTFLDSRGIAFLVRTQRFHRQAGRSWSVTGTNGQPARVLELAGLDDLASLVERYG